MGLFTTPVLGIDISDHSIEALLVMRRGMDGIVSSYGRVTLPAGLVQGGEIVDTAGLGREVRKLLKERMTPPLPKGVSRVAFAMPESQVHMHVFEVPRQADERELGASLAIEADGFFPFTHKELVGGYAVIAQRPDKKEIYYAAVRRTVLDAYRAFFASIGLSLVAVEAESSAIARAVLAAGERDACLLVDVGARVTDISVYDREGIHFSETLGCAGIAFTEAVARETGASFDDAETAKTEHGFSDDADEPARRALLTVAEALFDGVERAIAYYEGRSGRAVKKVLFCGGSAMMPGLMERAAARLAAADRSRSVTLADPWVSARPSEALERLGIRSRNVLIATALGLGLRGAKIRKFPEIDFLSGSAKPRPVAGDPSRLAARRSAPFRVFGLIALAAVVVGALVWGVARRPGRRSTEPKAPPSAAGGDLSRLDLRVTMTDAYSPEAGTVSGTLVETPIHAEKAFSRDAVRVEGNASGTLEILNGTKQSRALVATTRFVSENGTVFRSDRAIAVPGGGKAMAHVTADRPGESGDVPAGTFKIPGLAPRLQTQIYGRSTEPMRGGLSFLGKPFTEEERAKAVDDLSAQVKASFEAGAAGAAGKGMIAPQGLASLGDLDIKGMPPVGSSVADYEAQADAISRRYVLKKTEIEEMLRHELGRVLGPATDTGRYTFKDLEVTVERFDAASGTASLDLRGVVVKS